MAVSDKKKCQTLINVCALRVQELQEIATKLEAYQAAYVAQGVDPTGTALEGHVAQVSAWIDDVRGVADNAIANGFIANYVPTHRNKALGDL